jgi:hypothetical protein
VVASVDEEGVGEVGDVGLLGEGAEVFGRTHESVVDHDVAVSPETVSERAERDSVLQAPHQSTHTYSVFNL